MMIGGEAFLAWVFLLLAGGGSRSTEPSSPRAPAPRQPAQLPPPAAYPASTAPPWPQVVPSGLPAFPGSGWEYDEPPPSAVQQRAGQLLSQLWAGGSGTFKIEQTAGRWISYRAEIVKSGKQGVVAYRLKVAKQLPTSPASKSPKTASTAPSRPVVTSKSPGLPQPPRAPEPAAAAVPAPVAMPSVVNPPTPPSIAALPDRKYGDGMPPAPKGDAYVLLAQQKLAALGFLHTTPDGRFGNDTRNAAIAFQVRVGLAPADQTPEQLKARGFGAVKQATWKKLFEARA